MTDFKRRYKKEIVPKLMKTLGYKNPLAVPSLVKIVLNIGLKEALTDKSILEKAGEELAEISGQKPRITRARKSISSFKIRRGDPIGSMVTLRGKRMYDFLEKLVTVVLPRLRDFRGVEEESFDGQGNYTLGIAEQIVFPEIDYNKINKIRGLEITFVTSAKNDEEGKKLLEFLGMPFKTRRERG